MRRSLLLITAASLALAGVVGAACKTKAAAAGPGDDEDGGNTQTQNPPVTGDDDNASDAGDPSPSTGLPCDVETVLENNCTVCHSATATGATPPLVTYDDLKAPSTADGGVTRAVLAVQYMTDHTMPKPPAQPVDADEIQALQDWITAGYPKNPDACVTGSLDAGPPSDAGIIDAGNDSGCVSNVFWTGGNSGSELMHPGGTCIACHTANQGPKFRFAGTVYTASHEPNDCDGVPPPPTTVTVTDRTGKTLTLETNDAGNFDWNPDGGAADPPNFKAPYTVKLTQGTKTRSMNRTITGGDCNGCHTQVGDAGAPGRILEPQ